MLETRPPSFAVRVQTVPVTPCPKRWERGARGTYMGACPHTPARGANDNLGIKLCSESTIFPLREDWGMIEA